MLTKHTLARSVKHFRVTAGLSTQAAAKAAGIRANTWNDLEQAKANPRLSTLEAVAFTLGVTVENLFGGLAANLKTLSDDTRKPV